MKVARTLLQGIASPRGLWASVAAAVAGLASWAALLGAELAAAAAPKRSIPASLSRPADAALTSAALRVAGSGSTVAALRATIAACRAAGQVVHVQVEQGIGSSGGLRALADGAIDAALLSRPLGPGELRSGWVAIEYARSAVTFASPANTFGDPDGQSLLALLAAPAAEHPRGRPLTWLLREPGDSGHQVMAQRHPAFAEMERRARAQADSPIYFHDRTLHAALLSTESSVGVVDASAVRAEGLPLHLYRWGAVSPDAAAVASGAWPFVKPHSLVYPAALAQRFAPLLACLDSVPGRQALLRVGTAPPAN